MNLLIYAPIIIVTAGCVFFDMSVPVCIAINSMWIAVLYSKRRNLRAEAARQVIKKRRKEGKTNMKGLAKRFVNKECLIHSFDNAFEGVIKEVSDSAILVENKGATQAINLDFVVRITDFPKNKKGKKKSVVFG